MHRHLSRFDQQIEVFRAHVASHQYGEPLHVELKASRLYCRLRRTRFGRYAENVDLLTGWSVYASTLAVARQIRPHVVLAVAELPVFHAAVRVARRLGVPIVSVVHDWSTVWLNISPHLRARADAAFVARCRQSTASLSVSPELAAVIGPEPKHRVLYPIPGAASPTQQHAAHSVFHATYAGVFHYFQASEISALCQELTRQHAAPLLRIWGPPPACNRQILAPVLEGGYYAGLASQAEIADTLAASPALFVVCPFSEKWRQFSQYSFPSKIPEYCRFGRPIVLWAPPYAAAARWARDTSAAYLIDSPDPTAVVTALVQLRNDSERCAKLSSAARLQSQTTFAPERLQRVLEEALIDSAALIH